MKFEAEDQEFAKFLRSLKSFANSRPSVGLLTVGLNNFGNKIPFTEYSLWCGVSFLSKSRTHFSLKLFLVKIRLSYDKICSGKARKIFKIDFPSRLKGDPKKLKNPRVIWNLLTRPSWQLCTVWVVFFYSGKSWHGKKSI